MLVVTLPFRAWLGLAPNDFASTISILLVVWNCDTGALLLGRICHKLGFSRLPVPAWILQISPAKSMEGFLGGILGGVWTAISWIPILVDKASLETSPAFEALWETPSSRFRLGMTLSLLAIIGDLVESSIKRQSQAKDSGSFLPGHGGILDRFDSSLLAVLFYCHLLTVNA
jgi:phosphatidate cytidylyltransferase